MRRAKVFAPPDFAQCKERFSGQAPSTGSTVGRPLRASPANEAAVCQAIDREAHDEPVDGKKTVASLRAPRQLQAIGSLRSQIVIVAIVAVVAEVANIHRRRRRGGYVHRHSCQTKRNLHSRARRHCLYEAASQAKNAPSSRCRQT